MKVASENLGLDLKVRRFGSSRFECLDIARKVLHGNPVPDYLVFPYMIENGSVILREAENCGVNCFTVNMGIPEQDRLKIGYPGDEFKHWIGHIEPDDVGAGRMLARELVQQYKASDSGMLPVVLALNGTLDTAVGPNRLHGLLLALESESVCLARHVYAYWDEDVAARKARLLVEKYPDAHIIWAASDRMALAAREVVSRHAHSDEYFIGGVDWSNAGLRAIKEGRLNVSVGGHFMEGAWALVMIYDHHRRFVFSRQMRSRHSSMAVANRGNVDLVCRLLDPESWKKINFRKFTRSFSGSNHYDFSIESVFSEIE